MKEYTIGIHKVTAENIDGAVRLTWYENMGGRWSPLGPGENYSPELAAEILADMEG